MADPGRCQGPAGWGDDLRQRLCREGVVSGDRPCHGHGRPVGERGLQGRRVPQRQPPRRAGTRRQRQPLRDALVVSRCLRPFQRWQSATHPAAYARHHFRRGRVGERAEGRRPCGYLGSLSRARHRRDAMGALRYQCRGVQGVSGRPAHEPVHRLGRLESHTTG